MLCWILLPRLIIAYLAVVRLIERLSPGTWPPQRFGATIVGEMTTIRELENTPRGNEVYKPKGAASHEHSTHLPNDDTVVKSGQCSFRGCRLQ